MVGLLDDPCDQVTFAPVVDRKNLITFCIAQTLQDDLFGCRCGDPSEVLRRIKPFIGDIAVLVEFLTIDADLPGVGIDRNASLLSSTRRPLVGGYKGVRQRFKNDVARDTLLPFKQVERIHQVVIHRISYASLPGRGLFSHT